VIRLCRRLDGIPLAIELATVWLRTLSLEQLTSRLDHRFGLLTGGRRVGLAHQQTLRATTQWSYDLCSAAERLLWARLSVFAGSFDIPAAETVCTGGALAREDVLPTLIGLVDKSVVLRTDDDGARYWLLDTIREFGAERLAGAGEQDARQEAHIAYFRAMAGDFGRHAKDDAQLPRYRRLRREHANLRAALGYALDRPGRAPEAARLAADLRAYWEISGLLREGRHWLTKVLLRFRDPSAERAWLLLTRGRHAEAAGAGAIAETRLHAINHVSGLVSLDIHLGYLHLLSGELSLAIDRCAQGLLRLGDGGERWAHSYLQLITALALLLKGENEASAAAARESVQMKHELGDLVGTAYCLHVLALLTSRERQIAALVAEGMSNRDIAQRLAISKRTVDAHLEHIFGKLGISSRVQLTTWLSSAPTAG
jgi:predicted ATPase